MTGLARDPPEEPRHAIALVVRQNLELGEGFPQLSGPGVEATRLATDFAEAGDGEQTTGRQPLDQFSIQPWLPVHVAHHQIHRRPWRQTLIQIPDLEPTLIGNAAALCQLAGEFDGDGRDIDTEHIHAPKGQPDRQLATAGGDF